MKDLCEEFTLWRHAGGIDGHILFKKIQRKIDANVNANNGGIPWWDDNPRIIS